MFEWQLTGEQRKLVAPHYTTNYEPEILAGYLERFSEWEEKDQDLYENQLLQFDGIELISEDVLYNDEAGYLAKPHVKATCTAMSAAALEDLNGSRSELGVPSKGLSRASYGVAMPMPTPPVFLPQPPTGIKGRQ